MKFFNSGTQTDKLARASQAAHLRDFYRSLLDTPRTSDPSRLLKFGYRVYSQADEDRILREIFRRIGEGHRTFVELGSGNGLENHTLFLLTQAWSGLFRRLTQSSRGSAGTARLCAGRLQRPRNQCHLCPDRFERAPRILSAIHFRKPL